MSFEKYNQIFNSQKEGVLLKPMGEAKTFDFKLEVKPNTRYRLFTTGNAKQYYCWDTLEDYPSLYRDITDSLNTENAVSSQYCLDFSSKEFGEYVRRIYKKIMWPPRASILRIPSYTDWEMGVSVKAQNLEILENGFLQMRVDVRLEKPGVSKKSIKVDPDYSYILPIPAGSYDQTALLKEIEIPQNTASVGVFIEGKNYIGKCYLEAPHLSSHNHNLVPDFAIPNTYHTQFSWTGQYLSHKELPEFEVTLNGHKIYEGEIFERCHLKSEWELDLPTEFLMSENTISYRLISDYHDPLPYNIFEVGVIENEAHPLTVIAVEENGALGGKARVLVKTEKNDLTVKINCLSDLISAPKEITFKEAGLHGILIDCVKTGQNAEFELWGEGFSYKRQIERILIKDDDGVIVGTGDMIYILQETKPMEDYLCWYFSNNIGNFITIRPCYAWSGTKVRNGEVWVWFKRLMEELNIKYVLMTDGRQLPGLTANPSLEDLEGECFLGKQAHETDSMYYSGQGEVSSLCDLQYCDMSAIVHKENPEYSTCGGDAIIYYNGDEVLLTNTKKYFGDDYANWHKLSVEQLERVRGSIPRHTGPSCAFKYLSEAGYSWLGAETAYSSYEPLLAFLRGFAKAKGMDKFGVHHALQWSTAPHNTMGKYRRYRLMQYVSYMLGVTDINTEEGLWRFEENFSDFHRFSDACVGHIEMQKQFYKYLTSHSRKGEFYTPIAAVYGRDDGFLDFAYVNAWNDRLKNTEAEKSWQLLNLFYPVSRINGSIYNYYAPENEPITMFTGTPYGNVDAIPLEICDGIIDTYKTLVFFGYNRMTEDDAEKLLEYAKNGGRVMLTRAHLTSTTSNSEIANGNLEFLPNALSFCDGEPIFKNATFGGQSVAVCENAHKPTKVLISCDGGEPLLVSYKVGKGEILMFNVKEYPANSAIKPIYEEKLKEIALEEAKAQEVWVMADQYVGFAAYDLTDGCRHLYILATDWYREDCENRTVTVRIKNAEYSINVPFGTMLKCVVKDGVGAFCNSEKGEVLAVSENEILVQGTGEIEFTLLKNGEIKKISVNFDGDTVKTISI